MPKTISDTTKSLNATNEAIDRLRQRRNEIKVLIAREDTLEQAEAALAKELNSICEAIAKLGEERMKLYDALKAATS